MSKKVKVLISVVMTIVLVAIGTTTVVMAQEEPESAPEVRANGLLARVADILDIPEEDMIGAFKQARQELMQERHQAMMGKAILQAIERAVAEGLIDEEEAGEIIEWWEQRPEALDQIWQACPSVGSGLGDGNMWNKRWHSDLGRLRADRGWHGMRPLEPPVD